MADEDICPACGTVNHYVDAQLINRASADVPKNSHQIGWEVAEDGRMICGVCRTIANRFSIPVWLVRVAFVLASCFYAIAIILYIVLAVIWRRKSVDELPSGIDTSASYENQINQLESRIKIGWIAFGLSILSMAVAVIGDNHDLQILVLLGGLGFWISPVYAIVASVKLRALKKRYQQHERDRLTRPWQCEKCGSDCPQQSVICIACGHGKFIVAE
ncbi:MAG TPA: PspC domain-containing protein [Acidobacteriaceae bacterium]